MYPEFIEIDDRQYKINTDYRVALACFRAIEDNSINDIARTIAVVSLLFGKEKENGDIEVPEFSDLRQVIIKIEKYLSCGNKESKNNTIRDMDFEYDRSYITASFMSDYHLDLEQVEHMHWWKFCELLNGLTENCILSKVREIRNIDLEDYKDEKTRNKILKAMDNVKLPAKLSMQEEEAINEFENLFR